MAGGIRFIRRNGHVIPLRLPTEKSDIKANPKAPPVTTLARRDGSIVPVVDGRRVLSAAPMVEGRINEMIHEVRGAEKGGRGVSYDRETGTAKAFKTYGTFPTWYKEIGFKNKQDFENTILKQKGIKYTRLGEQAINDLNHGYQTSFGRVPGNTDFRVKTRQAFDNRGVQFRTIDDKVRPMRFKSVPF